MIYHRKNRVPDFVCNRFSGPRPSQTHAQSLCMALLPYVPARCGHREHSEIPALLALSCSAQQSSWRRSARSGSHGHGLCHGAAGRGRDGLLGCVGQVVVLALRCVRHLLCKARRHKLRAASRVRQFSLMKPGTAASSITKASMLPAASLWLARSSAHTRRNAQLQ